VSVTFQISKDGKTMTLTQASRAYIRSEENRILAKPIDEFAKANEIHMLYQLNGIEEDGTFNKAGWSEANMSQSEKNAINGVEQKQVSLSEALNSVKWIVIGTALIGLYQAIHHIF
jgi:DNA transposition AAA+ family ATPase